VVCELQVMLSREYQELGRSKPFKAKLVTG